MTDARPIEDLPGADLPVAEIPGVEVPDVEIPGDTTILEVIPVDEFLGLLEELIGAPEEVPNFLDVPFSEYSVTDGLLVLILFFAFLSFLWNLVKEAF